MESEDSQDSTSVNSKDSLPPEDRESQNPGDLNDLSGKEWIKKTKSWFICDSRRYHQNRDTELHPARYPEEMVSEFLLFFTKAGGWVLDPFCGSGATLISCLETGRHGIGVELSEQYVQMARSRLPEESGANANGQVAVIQGDARRIASGDFWNDVPPPNSEDQPLPQFDFIITSPPYWNILHKSRGGVESTHQQRADRGLDTYYSDRDADLGNIEDYDAFIEKVGGAFDECSKLLRGGKYLVCVAQNCRAPDGEVKPIAWDLADRISQTLSFQGERIWCQNSKQLGIWGYPSIFVPNYHHHYCLIFRKPEDD